jgi:hypothetical protein
MVDKTIKTNASSNPEKPIKAAPKAKPKKVVQPDVLKTPQVAEKKMNPPKKEVVVKKQETKKKRIPKGLATHNRRVKQEKRNPGVANK